MLTDDPGTPGGGHWEINVGWITQRTPGATAEALPDLDLNYGLGDRWQLTYETTWAVARDAAGTRGGLGDSQVAVKWRYLDGGEQGWQASVFPRVIFLDPGSHSDRRGLAGADSTVLLPAEVEKNLGAVFLDIDAGHTLGSKSADQGWMGGLEIGRRLTKAWEVDAEVRLSASEHFRGEEWIENLGTQVDLAHDITLLASVGRDLRNTLAPRATLISYLGIQLRL